MTEYTMYSEKKAHRVWSITIPKSILLRGLMRVILAVLTVIQALIAVGALLAGDDFILGMGTLGAALSLAVGIQLGPLLREMMKSRDDLSMVVSSEVNKRTEQLASELRKAEEAALVDPLTGAYNRRGGEILLDRHLARSKRNGTAISVIMVDLDHFKKINDQFGHIIGDLVLSGTVKTIKNNLRDSDFVVRWGGEELVIVLPDTNLHGAVTVAEKMRVSVSEIEFDHGSKITASFGVSEIRLDEDFQTALARADTLLYVAKIKGRNCVLPDSSVG